MLIVHIIDSIKHIESTSEAAYVVEIEMELDYSLSLMEIVFVLDKHEHNKMKMELVMNIHSLVQMCLDLD